jgi:hypothetical protein
MNLTNFHRLSRSPIITFVRGFFRKPAAVAPVAPVDPIGSAEEDATRTIYVTAYDSFRSRILFRTFVKCPVSAAPARIASRVAEIKRVPDRSRIWMTDDSDRAQNWQYRYRMIRHPLTGKFHARLIDPRRR